MSLHWIPTNPCTKTIYSINPTSAAMQMRCNVRQRLHPINIDGDEASQASCSVRLPTWRTTKRRISASCGRLGKQWRDYQGMRNWEGLLDPVDQTLRSEILRYGQFINATYKSFDVDLSSPTYASLVHRNVDGSDGGDGPASMRPMVENGFLIQYTSQIRNRPSLQEMVRQEATRLVEKYGDRDEPLSLTITGHSLGAALAILTAYDLRKLLVRKRVAVTVISFGGPRVGNNCQVYLGQSTRLTCAKIVFQLYESVR